MVAFPKSEQGTEKTEKQASRRVSMSKFFQKTADECAEWVDGAVFYLTVSDPHQNILQFLASTMRLLVEETDAGIIRTEPYPMKLAKRPAVRVPDVMFVAKENLARVKTNYVDGPVDIAVEIISPESRTRDRRDKFFEYAQAGVREYWMIDYERQRAEFYKLGEESAYDPISISTEGEFRSEVLPGFWIKVEWLWQNPLPKLRTVLKAWNLL